MNDSLLLTVVFTGTIIQSAAFTQMLTIMHQLSLHDCYSEIRLTWSPTSPHTLLVCVKAVLVSTAASVPEACAALGGCVVVPLEDKFGTRTFFFGKFADVCGF